MSTKIECTTCADVTIGLDRAAPPQTTGEFYIFMGEEGHYVLRADFLAAVEAECGVRMVPTDAVVIERAELPKVIESDIPHAHEINGHTYSITEAAVARGYALNLLALAEYLAAHPPTPPVDEADVDALAGLMDDAEAAVMSATSLARRLLATGRVSVTR